jgi:hypothetical protein
MYFACLVEPILTAENITVPIGIHDTFVAGFMIAMRGMGGLRSGPGGPLALAATAALLGCGSPTAGSNLNTPGQHSSSVASSTAGPNDLAVVTAFVNATAAFVHAEQAMDPDDPGLPATMTGEELSAVKKNLIIDKAGGLVARGDITPSHPHIVSRDAQTAVIRDCVHSALLLYDAWTGGPAPGTANGPQDIGITATFVNLNGTWKESLADLKVGSCPLGY